MSKEEILDEIYYNARLLRYETGNFGKQARVKVINLYCQQYIKLSSENLI